MLLRPLLNMFVDVSMVLFLYYYYLAMISRRHGNCWSMCTHTNNKGCYKLRNLLCIEFTYYCSFLTMHLHISIVFLPLYFLLDFSQTILYKIYVAADRRNSLRLLTVKCDWDFEGGEHYGFLFSLWYAVCNAVFLKQ